MTEQCKKILDKLQSHGFQAHERMPGVKKAEEVLRVLDALLCEYCFGFDEEKRILKINVFPAVSYDGRTFIINVANGVMDIEEWDKQVSQEK